MTPSNPEAPVQIPAVVQPPPEDPCPYPGVPEDQRAVAVAYQEALRVAMAAEMRYVARERHAEALMRQSPRHDHRSGTPNPVSAERIERAIEAAKVARMDRNDSAEAARVAFNTYNASLFPNRAWKP